jgi:hypothetical protein
MYSVMYVLISETGPVRGGVMGVGGVRVHEEESLRQSRQFANAKLALLEQLDKLLKYTLELMERQ